MLTRNSPLVPVLLGLIFLSARCAAAGDTSLDFLLGEWAVINPAGEQVATSSVTAVLPGAALQETRMAKDGRELRLWYFYSEARHAWTSVFQGPHGAMRELVATEINGDGSVLMHGRFANPDGSFAQSRFNYTKLPDGQVRRVLEVSEDDGRTWKVLVDARYQRKG